MGQKGRTTTIEERVAIGEQAQAGKSSREIAEELGRPIATVQKWRQKYAREGRACLSCRMGRPATGVLGQSPPELRQAILDLRDTHPGWGPQTLRLELAKDGRFTNRVLPSRARIAAYLKKKCRVHKYEQHVDLPEARPQPIQRPHQEWEMDAQVEVQVAGIGKVSFINILDVHSHSSIGSQACQNVSHPKGEAYRQVLRGSFLRFGLPEQISLDHDNVFYDNQSASPFPSQIHLWLIALGIQVRFIHRKPPLEHARIERYHQTIAKQAFAGQTFASLSELQCSLQARMLFLNQQYPTRSLNGLPPLQAFPQASHSGRSYRPEWEESLLDMQRVYDYLQTGRWFRKTSSVGTFTLGDCRYYATSNFARQTLEITFDAIHQRLICLPEFGPATFQLDVHGLTKSILIGNPPPLASFIPHQLAFPFASPDTTL